MLGIDHTVPSAGARIEVRLDPSSRSAAARAARRPRRRASRLRPDAFLQQSRRGLPAESRSVRADGAEQLVAAGQPGPRVVVGDARQRRERLGKSLREIARRASKILASGVHHLHGAIIHDASRAGLPRAGMWDNGGSTEPAGLLGQLAQARGGVAVSAPGCIRQRQLPVARRRGCSSAPRCRGRARPAPG